MTLEAISRIDYQAYRKFFLFTMLQSRKPRWQAPVLAALAPLLAIAFLVLYLVDRDDILNLAGFLMMLGITLVLAGLIFFVPKRYYLAMADQLMIPTRYRFFDDHLDVQTDGQDDWQDDWQETYPFENIKQAHRTADYFFINLGPGRICMIGNEDFTSGSSGDLHKLLALQLGERFIVLDKTLRQQAPG